MSIMRTTVAIDDHLLTAAKREGRRRGLTLGGPIEAALRRELAAAGGGTWQRPVVPILSGRGGLTRGVDATSNRALLELVDEANPIL
jgi:hypothetical protein